LPDSPPHSPTMGQRSRCRFSGFTNPACPLRVQEAGEKWTVAVDLQPTIPKSDRLLASSGFAEPVTQGFQCGMEVIVLRLFEKPRKGFCG